MHDGMTIRIVESTANPPGKCADAELHFTAGPLAGLKLIGFGIWERRSGGGRNVTFPARQYAVNGERRSFALLRPTDAGQGLTTAGQDRIREAILQAYAEYLDPPAPPASPLESSADAAEAWSIDARMAATAQTTSGPKDDILF